MAKKRGNGEGTIYKRKDSRWSAAVDFGWQNGKRKRKTVYGNTRGEVAEKLTVALRAQRRGLPMTAERLTVGDFLERWLLDSAKPQVRPNTFDGYERVLRLHVIPEIGHDRLARLTPQRITQLYERLLAKGLKPRYVRLAHAVLRRALGQAERWNEIPRNPAALVDPPRAERSEVAPLGAEEIDQLLAVAKGDPLEALYVLAVTTGLRQGELLGLRWQNVDLGVGRLAVRQQVQRSPGGWAFTEPKTASIRRVVRLPRIAVDALNRHRVDQLEQRLAHGPDWTDHDLVFPNSRGGPIERQNLVRRSFKPLLQHAGLRPTAFHNLRHSAARLLLAQGIHPKVVQERLGHSSISVTMDVYSHVLPSIQNEAVDALDRHFGPDRDRVAVNPAVKAGSGTSGKHAVGGPTR